jgi:hypothetical protein
VAVGWLVDGAGEVIAEQLVMATMTTTQRHRRESWPACR